MSHLDEEVIVKFVNHLSKGYLVN